MQEQRDDVSEAGLFVFKLRVELEWAQNYQAFTFELFLGLYGYYSNGYYLSSLEKCLWAFMKLRH